MSTAIINISHLFHLALCEIDKSINILNSNECGFLNTSLARQAFEICSKLELFDSHPEFINVYLLYLRAQERAKFKKSQHGAADRDKYMEKIESDIRGISRNIKTENLKWGEKKVDLSDPKVAMNRWPSIFNTLWGKQNKDNATYNKMSEAAHVDILYLGSRFLDGRNADALSFEVYEYWRDRAMKVICRHVPDAKLPQ